MNVLINLWNWLLSGKWYGTVQEQDLRGRFSREYLRQLLIQIKHLDGCDESTVQEIANIADSQQPVQTSALYSAESVLVKCMPPARLQTHLTSIKIRYEHALGHPLPDLEDNAGPSRVQEYAQACLADMYREIESRVAKELQLTSCIRGLSFLALFAIAVPVLAVIYVSGYNAKHSPPLHVPPFVLVATAGFVGGLLSLIKDLLQPKRADLDLMLYSFELETAQKMWPYRLLAGVVFSTLFLLIVSAVAGAWLGASVVSALPKRQIQMGMTPMQI